MAEYWEENRDTVPNRDTGRTDVATTVAGHLGPIETSRNAE